MSIKRILKTLALSVVLGGNILGMEKKFEYEKQDNRTSTPFLSLMRESLEKNFPIYFKENEVIFEDFSSWMRKSTEIFINETKESALAHMIADLKFTREQALKILNQLEDLHGKNTDNNKDQCVHNFKNGTHYEEEFDPLCKENLCQVRSAFFSKLSQKSEPLSDEEKDSLYYSEVLTQCKHDEMENGISVNGGYTQLSLLKIEGLLNSVNGEAITVNSVENLENILNDKESIVKIDYFKSFKPKDRTAKAISLNSILRKAYHALCLIKFNDIVYRSLEETIKKTPKKSWLNKQHPSFKIINVNLGDRNKRVDAYIQVMSTHDSFCLVEELINEKDPKIISFNTIHKKGNPPSSIFVNVPCLLKKSELINDMNDLSMIIQSVQVKQPIEGEEAAGFGEKPEEDIFCPGIEEIMLWGAKFFLDHRLYPDEDEEKDTKMRQERQKEFLNTIKEIETLVKRLQTELGKLINQKELSLKKFSTPLKMDVNKLMTKIQNDGGIGRVGFICYIENHLKELIRKQEESWKTQETLEIEKFEKNSAEHLRSLETCMEILKAPVTYSVGNPTNHPCNPRIIHFFFGNLKTVGNVVSKIINSTEKFPKPEPIFSGGSENLKKSFYTSITSVRDKRE